MSCEIHFFNENVSYVIRNKGILRSWITNAIERECKTGGDLNFILCDDPFIADLNFKYLKLNTLTDILTFSSDDENGLVCGDIFISITRVKENAITFKQTTADELHRVMIHGILHLIGYKDSSKKEKKEMRVKENFYLELLKSI